MYLSTLAGGASTARNTNYILVWGALMNWKTIFSPERKIDWADIADEIRESVTMDDVIHAYAPDIRTRHHRCPCPFHNGKDYNFSYTRNGYKCFVCGVSGDVITFVKDSLGLSTRVDAMKRINADLRLNLPIDANVNAEISADMARKREEREKREREAKEWVKKREVLLDEWIELDRVKRTADPMSAEYANAVKRIDIISYQLDCQEGDKPSNF